MDVDRYLLWQSARPPEVRKAMGFVDCYLDLCLSPQMPQDESYMGGWNEASEMGDKAQSQMGIVPRYV